MNKRKVLDAARKLAQKGAKQKALKEYDKLLAADPRDAKLMLEVGDAYRRWGQVEDAISQYTKVAAQFRQDGFDARAVAVYKQILNLDSKRFETYVQLGELYQHMGLDAEAIGSLQTAADGYHKEGNKPRALELLRKMAALDPSNTTSRMKVADLLKQEGMNKEAVAEYGAVADELKRQGTTDSMPPVLERILEIQPESIETLRKLATCYLDLNRADRAEPVAARLADLNGDADDLERLCSIYRSLGRDEKLAETTRSLAKLYRDRGDEDQAREIMQRLPSEAVVESGGLGRDQSELEEPALSDDDLLDDDEFLLGDDGDEAALDLGADLGARETVKPRPAAPAPDPNEVSHQSIVVPEGDPDQLFAEASVYLRYGKVEQAIASLKGILLQVPDHRGALEKLGEAAAEQGDSSGAVANWRRAAEIAFEQGDASSLDLLRDRVRGLDSAAADALPTLQAAPPPAQARQAAVPEEEPSIPDEFEIDLDLDVEAPSSHDADPAAQESDEPGDIGIEIDLDADDDLASALADASDDAEDDVDGDGFVSADTSEFEIDLSQDAGIDLGFADDDAGIDLGDAGDDSGIELGADDTDAGFDPTDDQDGFELDIDVEAGFDDAASSASAAGFGTSASVSGSAEVKEQLEEAEFYFQQDLYDEAEAIYRRVLAQAPGHPSALLRLGEISVARGATPAVAAPSARPVEEAALEIGLDASADSGVTGDGSADFELAFDDDAFSADDETEDSTEVAMLDSAAAAAAETPTNPLLAEDLAEAALARDGSIDETQPFEFDESPGDAPAASVAVDDGDSFDLAAELAGAFEEANAPAKPDKNEMTGSVLSKVDDGFESIFSDFKKGVSAALEEGDFETRYDLGIAYREMGLYEDAIAEFRVCLDSANRRLESLHMMGLCALDLGRCVDAVNHLEQALATADLAEHRKVGVYFDLARAHEFAGDPARAESVYLEVQSLDANFPGLAKRLEAVRGGGGGAAPLELASAGGLESFNDLFADDVDEDGDDEQVEAFESFDDVITSVESEPVDAEPMDAEAIDDDDDVPTAEFEIPDDGLGDAPVDPGSSGRRKKKISFV